MPKKVLFKDVEYTRMNGDIIQFRGIKDISFKIEILRIDPRNGIHPAPINLAIYEINPYIDCLRIAQRQLLSFKR